MSFSIDHKAAQPTGFASQEVVDQIVELEWPMFRQVNGEERTDCQNNQSTFHAMRRAQFNAWSQPAAQRYLADLNAAKAAGRNLAREKYIRMMEHTDPAGFARFQGELPPLSAEQERLISRLWDCFLAQTERLRRQFPAVALGGRPLLAKDEGADDTSIETYQIGEWKTYSEATLSALLDHARALEKQGIDLVRLIQENSVAAMGYPSLPAAERAISYRLIQMMGGGECSACGCRFH